MIFLVANIVCASLFALCIKWVELRQREDIVTVGMINYIAAAVISLPEFLQLAEANRTTAAFLIGATNGVSYFIAFFFCVYAIRLIGVANSTVISILSILAPILVGIFLWSERPNGFQVVGITLALISLTLIGGKGDAIDRGRVVEKPWYTPWVILSFFILCGLSRLAQEAFKHLCEAAERPTFLASAFVITAVPAVLVLALRGRRIQPTEWLIGVALGAANIFQAHFILKSLKIFDGFIVFPVVSAGSLMLVTLVATGMLGERLSRNTCLGITMACIALVLLKGFAGY